MANFFNSNTLNKTTKFPYLVLAVSILITLGVAYNYYQSANNKDLFRFNNDVNRIQTSVENKVSLYVALLKGGRGFIDSSQILDRENFSNYVKSLELEKNYTGVLGIGYTKIFTAEQLAALSKKMESEGYKDFKVSPDTKRDFYQPILYIEPFNEQNEKAVGYDMSTDETRHIALNLARDTGKAAATSKVFLIQSGAGKNKAGFLIYLPIYKGGITPTTVEERRNNLVGYIYSPFQADDFLKEIQEDTSTTDIDIKIYDGTVDSENLLAKTVYPENLKFLNQFDENYSITNNLKVGGRDWIIKYDSSPIFNDQSGISWTLVIFFSGIIFSFLLFGMTYWEASARTSLQNKTEELLEAEKQKAGLFKKEKAARLAAEQANKTKDEFIGVVSHELRTPLNAIAGWARILKTTGLSNNTKELAITKIEKNLRLQTRLVEELLDYSQVVSGSSDFAKEEVDLGKLLEISCQEVEHKIDEKRINLIKNNQLNGHRILGDGEKIKVVLRNLISNAIKFSNNGGKIETSLYKEDHHILLSVSDTGQGISPEFLPYIFDGFRQADNSTTRNYGGLGLGLAISSHIVKLHNGTIEAFSQGSGKGTTFVVKFPYLNN